MISEFNKPSHMEAEKSALKIASLLEKDINAKIFQADAMQPIKMDKSPDIIITDVPYGNLVSWEGDETGINRLLNTLYELCSEHTIIGISMDKKQKINDERFMKLERQTVGKRKFLILKKAIV